MGPGAFDQCGAVAQIPAEGDAGIGRAKAAAQEPEDVQIGQPLAIGHVALAAREVLDVTRVDKDDLKAARLEDLEYGDPVDASRLHGHVSHAAGDEPVGKPIQVAREGAERLDGRGVAIRRYCDEVFGRPAIKTGSMRMEALKGIRRRTRLGWTTAMALHQRLLYTETASGNRDAAEWQSPKRDHAERAACHQ